MVMWMEQQNTIHELESSRNRVRWDVEHNFHWQGKMKCDAVRDDTTLKGEAFDTMRKRFAQCECPLTQDYVVYCSMLKDAYNVHIDKVDKIFSGNVGTRWYMDEIERDIKEIKRQLAKLEDHLALNNYLWSQFSGGGDISNAMRDSINENNKVFLQKKDEYLQRLRILEDRKKKMLDYSNNPKIISTYDNVKRLGDAIRADLNRISRVNYNPSTGRGAFDIPADFGKERKEFWVEWTKINPNSEPTVETEPLPESSPRDYNKNNNSNSNSNSNSGSVFSDGTDVVVGQIIEQNGTGYTESRYARAGLNGQCTWYAYGRAYQVFGFMLNMEAVAEGSRPYGHAKYWLDNCSKDSRVSIIRDPNGIVAPAIAVNTAGGNGFGHVMFIEKVKRDSNGNPVSVLFSEANAGGTDGTVKELSWEEFKRQKRPAGYIVKKTND